MIATHFWELLVQPPVRRFHTLQVQVCSDRRASRGLAAAEGKLLCRCNTQVRYTTATNAPTPP